ncbi:MAG TPA: pitrilysin family protein [Dokdonella sp.]|uniref:M16 family metallopeptidase n=1 Tax=Dokdonella sp. TaxID=2291710 RepID=UPI002D7EF7EE|nr:pitrilysin family protein [Dokdonella sp.]HET9033237.1 pitrilysin family protein [Dokdonella sp.]
MLKLALTTLLTLGLAGPALAASDSVDIPFTRFTLPNGLTAIIHEDHKAPVVAVSIWYHVGSADEPVGKTGFAHLFEHLMFSGSENHKGTYFQPFEQVGATDMNGTTWFDRTNYFETVPTTALDMALWMESDRMGHLLGAIGQKELDTQRGVVQNEKRQGENRPYGRTDENILANAFPANHPYQHDTIGSMADLDAASLADVKQWFNDYYGAANTTIVLAGDITPEIAREKLMTYFGDIPAGPPVRRQQAWVAPRKTSTRGEQKDHVAQTRIIREWNVAQLGHADEPLLELAANALGGGKTSRLYQRLVYKDKLVDSISISVQPFALASQFVLTADVKQGVDPARVEKAIAEEWTAFLKNGPTDEELERSRMSSRSGFIRGLEKVGGFSGKATVLAESQVYRGDPAAYKIDLEIIQKATPESVKAAANRWIARGDYTLTVLPLTEGEKIDESAPKGLPAAEGKPAAVTPAKGNFTTTRSDLDRSKGVPEVSDFPDLSFPKIQRGMLKNGIEIVLAERHTIPVVQMQLQFDAGYASDQGRKLGTSSFAMALLDEGTLTLDSVEIARRSELLGAYIRAGSGLDASSVSLNALDSKLEPSLALFADVVRNPAFREADIERIRGQWLADIAQEKTQPTGIALRTLPPLLYGARHAYGIPFTGSGTEASIKSLTAKDLRRFHRDFIRPDNVKILIAGDTTLPAITAQLDKVFGDWQATETPVPVKAIGKVAAQEKSRVFLIDRPDSPQTLILTGSLAPSTEAPNNIEIQTMNGVFGGTFTSRLNMNLREDKRWAYGASSFLQDAIGQRPFMTYASVQTDKTAESAAEVLKEARAIIGDKPITEAEIDKIKAKRIRALPGSFETTGSVLGVLSGSALYNRPDNYVTTLKARMQSQKQADIEAAAREVIQPDTLTWVIVGDLKQIEKPVRALKLGEVKVLDADGKVVR